MTDETKIKEEVINLTLWDSIVYLCNFSGKFAELSKEENGSEHFTNASWFIYEAVKEIQKYRELHCVHKERARQDFIDFKNNNEL